MNDKPLDEQSGEIPKEIPEALKNLEEKEALESLRHLKDFEEPEKELTESERLLEVYRNAKPGDVIWEREVPVFIGWNLGTVVGKARAVMGEDKRVHLDTVFATHETEEVLQFFSELDPMAISFGGYNRINGPKPEVALRVTKGDPHPLKMNKKGKKK